jgi:hypothetical protein
MKAYTLELSGDEHFKLIATIEAAVFAGKQEIIAFLQDKPWSDYDWSVDDLLADPGQIKRADPDDENMGSDLRGLVYDLRDAHELLRILEGLEGRCEECGTPSKQLSECDKAYLCAAYTEKWENQ